MITIIDYVYICYLFRYGITNNTVLKRLVTIIIIS